MLALVLTGVLGKVAHPLEENPHWIAREKIIQEHNKNWQKHGWKMHHNGRFLGEPLGSEKVLLGAILRDDTMPLPVDAIVNAKYNLTDDIPTDFDSKSWWDGSDGRPDCSSIIGDIRDQSDCGCCWAFGGASAASDRLCIATNGDTKVPLSSTDLCFCASDDGCDGGMLYTSWSYIKREGLVTGGQQNNTGAPGGGWCSKFPMPHCHHHGPVGNDPYPSEGTTGCPSQSSPSCPKKTGRATNTASGEQSILDSTTTRTSNKAS